MRVGNKDDSSATNTLEGITLVSQPSQRLLSERQFVDYRIERERCIDWLLHFGKDIDRADR